jgi:hypothetical protein
MDIEGEKKHSYLDEYKILKTLGAGYHAQYFYFNAGSSWARTKMAGWSLSRNTKKKQPRSRLSSMNLTS